MGSASSCARSAQQRRRAPEDWRLAMQVSRVACPLEVIVEIVLSACPFTNIPDVTIRLQVSDQREPAFARGPPVSLFVEPSVLHASNHCKGEHAGARTLRPRFGMIEQL